MGFILDGLETESYDRNYSDRDLLKRIVDYFRPHAKRVLGIGLLILLNSATGTAGPILLSLVGTDRLAALPARRLRDERLILVALRDRQDRRQQLAEIPQGYHQPP